MAGILELSDQKFKITMNNMLRALKDKDHRRTHGQCMQRDGNPKKELKRN